MAHRKPKMAINEKLFAPLNKRIEAEADALRKTPERDHAELKNYNPYQRKDI